MSLCVCLSPSAIYSYPIDFFCALLLSLLHKWILECFHFCGAIRAVRFTQQKTKIACVFLLFSFAWPAESSHSRQRDLVQRRHDSFFFAGRFFDGIPVVRRFLGLAGRTSTCPLFSVRQYVLWGAIFATHHNTFALATPNRVESDWNFLVWQLRCLVVAVAVCSPSLLLL